jgi:hypothetical protein
MSNNILNALKSNEHKARAQELAKMFKDAGFKGVNGEDISLKAAVYALSGAGELNNKEIQNSSIYDSDITKKNIVAVNKLISATKIFAETIDPSLQTYEVSAPSLVLNGTTISQTSAVASKDLNKDGLLTDALDSLVPQTTIPSILNSNAFDHFSSVVRVDRVLMSTRPDEVGMYTDLVSSQTILRPSMTASGYNIDFTPKQLNHYKTVQVFTYNELESLFMQQTNSRLGFADNPMSTVAGAYQLQAFMIKQRTNLESFFGISKTGLKGLFNMDVFTEQDSTNPNALFTKTLGDYVADFYDSAFSESTANALNSALRNLLLLASGMKIPGVRDVKQSAWTKPTIVLPLADEVKMAFRSKISSYTLESKSAVESFKLMETLFSTFKIVYTAMLDIDNVHCVKFLGNKTQMLIYDAVEDVASRYILRDLSVLSNGAFTNEPVISPYNTYDAANYQFATLLVNIPFFTLDNRKSYRLNII